MSLDGCVFLPTQAAALKGHAPHHPETSTAPGTAFLNRHGPRSRPGQVHGLHLRRADARAASSPRLGQVMWIEVPVTAAPHVMPLWPVNAWVVKGGIPSETIADFSFP